MTVENFEISGSTVHLYKKTVKTSAEPADTKSSSDSQIIKIKHLNISDLQFYYLNENQNKPDTVFSISLDFAMWDFNTDSTAAKNFRSPLFQFDRVELSAENGELKVKNGLYNLIFSKMNFDSEQPDLTVASAEFISPYGKYEIGKHTGFEIDWYNLKADNIRFKNIKLAELLRDTALILREISIKNIKAEIFRDKRLPFPEKPDTKLPAELVQDIPFGLHSDSLVIQHADIEYEERAEESEQAGKVTFNSLHAKIKNISNSDSLKKRPMTLSAVAEVMNSATLSADFIFTIPETQQPSQVTGSLEPTQFSIFNPMVKPYAGVEIQSGQTERLAFNFDYNNVHSGGDMIFEYKNLDFVMLNKKDNSKKLVFTFLAKTFIVQKQNLQENNSYKKGEISHERDPKKSVFNYWWKSLLSGLKSVAVNP
ncbi:MAG: DUF748 domain-containing protein, partial [Tangfeifania sp.]